MDFLITTNEPPNIRNLFEERIETPMSFDMMLCTKSGRIGIERKKVPEDLLASVADGRLSREILAMRNECKFLVVLLHGKIFYDRSDNVKMYKSNRRWTRKGIRNLLRTLRYAEGCFIEEAHTDEELVTTVDELQQYFDRKQHISIHVRPGLNSNWFVHAKQEQLLYFYSGLPGISLTRAKKLVERYPRPIDLYGATVEQLCEIPKFGKITATKIKSFLETGET